MKAVLLVGGKGTRLRPLTYRLPKPLIPLMGKPLLMHVIDSLPEEIDETIVPVGYMKDKIEDYLEKNPPRRKITIIEEKHPLGTGGAVKNVEDYIDGPFLVINGDTVSSLDVGSFMEFHRKKKAFASISLWEVTDPTPFGIVELEDDQRICRFQEKPTKEEAFSNLANAGVYALEYEVLDHIGDGFVSMEREVFPRILDKGMYGLTFEGYWIDCGTRDSILSAFWTLMADSVEIHDSVDGRRGRISGPAIIRKDAVIGDGAVLGPYAYLSERTVVGDNARIEKSVVFEGAKIGRECLIRDSLIDVDVEVPAKTEVISTTLSGGKSE
ncbi:MAG: NDP-sugar synthase [Methanobacteriota archaeon]|nr:MAG: NDP-sugar synthase [Euryarchaeota archaeon]